MTPLTRALALAVAVLATVAAPWRMRAMHLMPAGADAAAHAAHASGGHHHGEPEEVPPAHAPGPCDGCDGVCCPVVSLTATPPIAAPTGAVAAVETVLPGTDRSGTPGTRPRLLPYANGPPA